LRKSTVFSSYDLAIIAVFAAFIALCSFITIPFAVPFTMQVFGVFFAIGMLGTKRALASVLIYLLLGAVGVPVFSGFQGGIHIILGQNGGFLIGFLVSVIVTGVLLKRMKNTFISVFLSMLGGLFSIYLSAVLWLVLAYTFKIEQAVLLIAAFVVLDVLKIALAAYLSLKINKSEVKF